jgi:PAS domain S-box-containing protein
MTDSRDLGSRQNLADPRTIEETFRHAFEYAAFGMALVGIDGCFLQVNPSACDMFGYTAEELITKAFQELTYPDDLQVGIELFQDLLAGRRDYGWLEKRYVRKDGKVIWTRLSTSAVRDPQGKPLFLVSQIQDITEQVQAQQMLEERVAARTQELSALYDVTAVSSASLDLQTVMEQSLDRVLQVMGCQIGGIHLLNEAKDQVSLAVWRDIPDEIVAEIQTMPARSGVSGRIVIEGKPLVVPAMADDPNAVPAARRILGQQVYIGAPMRAKGQVVGVLSIIGNEGRQFSAEEIALLASIADQIGVAVENAQLYQRAERLAVMEERQRLARELHDSVTQSIYSAMLLTETARRSAAAHDLGQVQRYLDELGAITQQALKEMRLLVYELRPPALEPEGLVGALQQRIDAVEGRAGIQARLLVESEIAMEPSVEEALYGIGQEALNNALKHAAAHSVMVRIRSRDDLLEMQVVDDGRGFDPEAVRERGGMGLTTMQERAEQVGGRLILQSSPGKGTTVRIVVPASTSRS